MKRRREEIKTTHAVGKMPFKEAKKAIMENQSPVHEQHQDLDKYMLDPNTFGELVAIARNVLDKNPDADPEKLLSRMEGEKRVRQLMKEGVINEGDLRDALSAASD